MKLFVILLFCALCIGIEVTAYIELKRFMSKHRDDIVEHIVKCVVKRCFVIVTTPVVLFSLMLILISFVK